MLGGTPTVTTRSMQANWKKMCKELDLLGHEIGFKTQRSRQCKLAVFLRHQTEKTIDGCRIGITPKDRQKQSRYYLEVVS